MKKVFVVIGIAAVIGLFVVLNLRREGTRVEVRVTQVKRKHITKWVTASGRIEAKRKVDVSASAIGKVTRLDVKEGDYVHEGDFLLQIDPTSYQSVVDQLEASIRSAKAAMEMEQSNVSKAEYDLERANALHKQHLISEEELRNTRIALDIARARERSSRELLAQHEANLKKASHDLREVRITAEISGVVTSLNVEEGENAIMGTLNNPGTVLLTVADLSEIEAKVEVDETEVVFVHVGQKATVTLDAYPDSTFAGKVTEVGNSAIRSQIGLGQSSVDFEVVVTLEDKIPHVRPGLSANAKIEVAEVNDALAVPIPCLTVRQRSDLKSKRSDGEHDEDDEDDADDAENDDVEGVFVVMDGSVEFRPVKVGIAGNSHFQILHGLKEGESVVNGPFKAINDLKDDDLVKIKQRSRKKTKK